MLSKNELFLLVSEETGMSIVSFLFPLSFLKHYFVLPKVRFKFICHFRPKSHIFIDVGMNSAVTSNFSSLYERFTYTKWVLKFCHLKLSLVQGVWQEKTRNLVVPYQPKYMSNVCGTHFHVIFLSFSGLSKVLWWTKSHVKVLSLTISSTNCKKTRVRQIWVIPMHRKVN